MRAGRPPLHLHADRSRFACVLADYVTARSPRDARGRRAITCVPWNVQPEPSAHAAGLATQQVRPIYVDFVDLNMSSSDDAAKSGSERP
jgi:hypothetical protein